MSGRVVLFGATGYTGELAAEEMVERGMRPLLAARSEEKLERLSARLGGLETAVAEVGRPESLRELLDAGDVLVTTVGPFGRWGSAAIEAAVGASAHYVDSTGEGGFIRRVFEREGPRAEAAACGLLTALGYDWVPGNLAGALALERAGEAANAVRIGYFFTGEVGASTASGGTKASVVDVLTGPGFSFRGGRIVSERIGARVAHFDAEGRSRAAISVGTSEAFALPRLQPGLRDVEVYLGWFGGASRAMSLLSLAMSGVFAVPGARDGVEALLGRVVGGASGGPDQQERAKTGSEIVAQALGPAGETLASIRLTGVNGYTFTAAFLAWAAERAAAGELQGTGALGPVDGFGLERLEAGVAEAGIERS